VNTTRIDSLVAGLASVRDEALIGEAWSADAKNLLSTVLDTRADGRQLRSRRLHLLALAGAVVLGIGLSATALGVVEHVRSWLAGGRGPDFPVPTGSDVVVAAGKAGAPWQIIATPSDRGLCLFLVTPILTGERAGLGNCAMTPAPGHVISAFGAGGGFDALDSAFAFGTVAEPVASVELLLTDGETLHAQLVRPGSLDGSLGVYWAAWHFPGPEVKLAVARDAAGRVLERRAPSWNGNPSGKPN
jgi:hypothetical protein